MGITVETMVVAPIKDVWRPWTTPEEIKRWNVASEDWHTTASTVDLRVGGSFSWRVEAKDGSAGFDFAPDKPSAAHAVFSRNAHASSGYSEVPEPPVLAPPFDVGVPPTERVKSNHNDGPQQVDDGKGCGPARWGGEREVAEVR